MSEQRAPYHTKPALRVVKPHEEAEETAQKSSGEASAIISQAVMYAAMAWVSCCMEQQGVEVNVMPLGGGLFDAQVRLAGGGDIWLRVRLILEAGPMLRTVVEPIHP